VGASAWRMENEGEKGGPGVAVGNAGRSAAGLGHRARAAPLSREQGRAVGMGDAGEGAWAADAWDRGEMGDPVSAAGCRKSGRERPGGDGAPIGGPERHSARWCGSNRI
jgi:hypothetical protein